jgi:hypothetical protein
MLTFSQPPNSLLDRFAQGAPNSQSINFTYHTVKYSIATVAVISLNDNNLNVIPEQAQDLPG